MKKNTGSCRRTFPGGHATASVVLLTVLVPLLVAGILTRFFNGVGQVALVIIGFGVLVFFHELGHFLAAKSFKIRCDVFSLGIGPRLCGWRKGKGFSFGSVPIGPPPKVEGDSAHLVQPTNLGETDYRIAWLPFGGYVRMLGQDDLDPTKVSSDPASFNNKPVWQRMIVISAGVVMNLILAFIIFVIAFRIGVPFEPAVIGGVEYNSPAMNAGLQVGDRVIAVNGRKPLGFLEFADLKMASALDSPGKPVKLTYIRATGGPARTIKVIPRMSKSSGFLMFGISEPESLKVLNVKPRQLKNLALSAPILTKIKPGSTITAINGHPISSYGQLYQFEQRSGGKPLHLTVRPAGGKPYVVQVRPTLLPLPGVKKLPSILGFQPLMKITAIVPGSDASKSVLNPGDVILRVGTILNPDWRQIRQLIKANPDQSINMQILRGGVKKALHVKIGELNGAGFLGIEAAPAYRSNIISRLVSPKRETNFAGDIITGVAVCNTASAPPKAYQSIRNWIQLYRFAIQHPNTRLAVRIAGNSSPIIVDNSGPRYAALQKFRFGLSLPLGALTEIQKTSNLSTALAMGIDHTIRWIVNTYLTLRGLTIGTVSPHQLHGVIGVAAVSYQLESQGFMYLLYFMGLISVNLAVINFLPLPILDGGLFVMLLLEKIRGRPLPLKVQAGIQIAGLILIGGVFLYVTFFNDIPMIFGH